VLIQQNGLLLEERYNGLGGITRGEFLASGTKSFSCALAVAAEDDGIMRIDDPASSAITSWAPGGSAPDNPAKNGVRIANLLSQTAGISNTGESGLGLNNVDSYRQAITARSAAPPDQRLIYGPNSFQALSAAFQLRTGGQLNADGSVTGGTDSLAYLQQRVLSRIGIQPTAWSRDVRGQPNFGGGASFTARDFATYGQFILQRGQWQGVQVLSAERIGRCSSYSNPAFLGYGFGFWLNRKVGSSYAQGIDSVPWPGDVLQ